MISRTSFAPVALAALPLLLAGCADAQWGEYAGGGRGMAGASAASGATLRGDISGEMIAGTVEIIARHESTAAQRAIAVRRAHVWAAAAPHLRHPRYIAIPTRRSPSAPRAAKASVILFDTEAGQVVGHNVYDIATPPSVGAIERFDTYSAQYVGLAGQ